MDKLVIIINGVGGVGKDTLCDLAAKHFKVRNISSITPIKNIASENGWNGEKDAKSRKFLSDLKRIFVEYNDLPTRYLYAQYEEFLESDEEILFAHIREAKEIEKLKNMIPNRCLTLLIERPTADVNQWGNASDDEVKNYSYDCYFENNKPLCEIEQEFVSFLQTLLTGNDHES